MLPAVGSRSGRFTFQRDLILAVKRDRAMETSRTITLELPIRGTIDEYAGAIALAIADANCQDDVSGASALVGLMSTITLPSNHNPLVELGPWGYL